MLAGAMGYKKPMELIDMLFVANISKSLLARKLKAPGMSSLSLGTIVGRDGNSHQWLSTQPPKVHYAPVLFSSPGHDPRPNQAWTSLQPQRKTLFTSSNEANFR